MVEWCSMQMSEESDQTRINETHEIGGVPYSMSGRNGRLGEEANFSGRGNSEEIPVLFENDFLYRDHPGLVSRPAVALTELVANAWDAGATKVKIQIPDKIGGVLVIEDNGIGMSERDIREKWMKLRYNRVKYQGERVEFPAGKHGIRTAYGRNGIGRHGLLCFGDEYRIITAKEGDDYALEISVTTGQDTRTPLYIREQKKIDYSGHRTRLEVVVQRNLPQADKVREQVSARFLHDPEFIIEVNGTALQLEDLENLTDTTEISVPLNSDKVARINISIIDTQKAIRKNIFHGVAMWQGLRLVGDPSWRLGENQVLDGRTTLAKRYTIIVASNDLADFVKEDWSGFRNCKEMDMVYKKITQCVDEKFSELVKQTLPETKELIKKELGEKFQNASLLAQYEAYEVVDYIAERAPKTKQESFLIAVEAILNLASRSSGQTLLQHLSELDQDDVERLNVILSKWSLKDALSVLDEIDKRLSIIEAIQKLSSDSSVDELSILHPLVTEARWIFGPEFDSSEYISNRQMQTVVSTLFGNDAVRVASINYKKRPDLVCLANSTISVRGIEDFDSKSQLPFVSKILLIELKRGGHEIQRKDVEQTSGYVEEIMASDLRRAKTIHAYVVGHSIAQHLQPVRKIGDEHEAFLYVTTYSQLIDSAERRLFGLRKKLSSMYDDIPGMELYNRFF